MQNNYAYAQDQVAPMPKPPISTMQPPPGQNIGSLAVMPGQTPGGLAGNISRRPSVRNPPAFGQSSSAGQFGSSQPGFGGSGGGSLGNLSDFQAQIDSAYDAQTRRLDPMFAQRESAFRQQMINQGVDPSSAAYQTQFNNFSRDRNDAYDSAGYGAQRFGLEAQGQFAGQQLQREGFANQRAIARTGANASMSNARTAAETSRYGMDLSNNQFMSNLGQQGYEFDVNDIFRTQGQDINAALGFGQLGLAQDQFGLQSWQAQNAANSNYFDQIGGLFGNAPGFTGFSGSSGLGANAVNAGSAQAQADAAQMQAIGSMVGGAAAFSSSKYKDLGEKVGTEKVLKAINEMDVVQWTYNDNSPSDNRDEHIGTTAEEFNDKLDLPKKDHIATVDAVGALMGSVQELTKRLERLESEEVTKK